jgi:hypothetical protein
MRRLFILVFILFPIGIFGQSVSMDISQLKPGECKSKMWNPALSGFNVIACRRTSAQMNEIRHLQAHPDAEKLLDSMKAFSDLVVNSDLTDKMYSIQQYVENRPHRSLKPEFFVALRHDTRIGCDVDPHYDSVRAGSPAFINPCHGQKWDYTGRLLPSQRFARDYHDLRIPPHRFKGNRLIIGENPASIKRIGHNFNPDFESYNEQPLYKLIIAAKWGRTDLIKQLMDQGVDLNGQFGEHSDNRALFLAISRYQIDVIKMLLEGGADPNIKTEHGFTPLSMATQMENPKIIALLKRYGAKE